MSRDDCSKGTYALIMHLPAATDVRVGRHGAFAFPAGHYVYVGSAMGAGGLDARVARHLRTGKKLWWHIDYLLPKCRVIEVWRSVSEERWECRWAQTFLALAESRVPSPHFGSSDCRCLSHLVWLPQRPTLEHLQRAWPCCPLQRIVLEPA